MLHNIYIIFIHHEGRNKQKKLNINSKNNRNSSDRMLNMLRPK